jgi:hypothetical protein
MRTAMLDAVATLRRQRMPAEEIRAVVTAEDPVIVRRYLELHRERLSEWLEEEQRIIGALERSLMGARRPIRTPMCPARHTAL